MRSSFHRAALVGAAITLASCSSSTGPGGGSPPPSTQSVTATTGQAFSPNSVQLAVGGTVTWVFQSLGHNVTFDAVAGAPADIGGVNANTSIARTFPTAGTFTYHCTIHPGMTGSVQVVSTTTQVGSGGNNAPPPTPGY